MPEDRLAPAVGGPGTMRAIGVAVTYRPHVPDTAALLRAVAPQVDGLVVVDNGSPGPTVAELRSACAEVGAELIELGANLGIAAAQNRGLERARARGADLFLLLDQDSLPEPDMVARLREGLARARGVTPGGAVAAVGPVTRDERQPDAPLLFHDETWGPRRAPLPTRDGELVPVTFLLASGCLVTGEALDRVGPMNEAWFIDHIDLEWGLRATRAGMAMYGVAGATLHHHLGDATLKLPGRARQVHLHSPIRNYYMARNTLLLVRSGLMRPAWRLGYAAWIVKYAGFYVLLQAPRGERVRELAAGLRDGLLGRTGPRRRRG